MLQELTRYLLQYKRLSIPHVGTFEVVQQAPEYNVVDKIILPPTYRVLHQHTETVSDHQLGFFASLDSSSFESAHDKLKRLGKNIRQRAEHNGFTWKGIGALSLRNGSLNFEDQLLSIEGLGTVPAHKVLRENVEHSRLVGDHQTTAVQKSKNRRRTWSLSLKWGWIILAIAVGLILFILIKNHFSPLGSGLKLNFFK